MMPGEPPAAMHEYSIARALLDQVEAHARTHQASAVHRIEVRIGELAGVEGDLLAAAYELVREGSPVCRGAALEVVPVAARWECPSCGRPIARGAVLRCAPCARPARLAAGEEILLERIEMEVA